MISLLSLMLTTIGGYFATRGTALLVSALRSGFAKGRYGRLVPKSEAPILFWLIIVSELWLAMFGACFLFMGLTNLIQSLIPLQ